jgi:poly(A) polymerase
MARARKAGLQVVPTGIAHGTVTVLAEGRRFEVTTLREDVETDGRHAIVRFGRDFDADARRRDFTINAMTLSRDGRLHDPVGGLADLAHRRLRFIGDARARIAEDYLRILRLFRFHAVYGDGPLDPDALAAAIAGRHGLARLSPERLQSELAKLLAAPRAVGAIEDMTDAGILDLVIAGVPNPARLARVVVIEATLGLTPDAMLRLGALAVDVSEDVARLRERLRLSNAVTRRLQDAVGFTEEHHGLDEPPPALIDEGLFRLERPYLRDALILLHADSRREAADAAWLAAHARAATAERPEFPISGNDLVMRGLPAGRRIGAALKTLQARWIRAGFPRDPAIVTRLIEDVIGDSAPPG